MAVGTAAYVGYLLERRRRRARSRDQPPGMTPGSDRVRPDLAVGLVTSRDWRGRPVSESAGMLPYVVELTATIANVGEATAGETATRFWLRGAGVDRELRVVNTPELLPGDEVEVTALWDLRDGSGDYVVAVTADAFAQLDEARRDNNLATARVRVRGTRVEVI